jgi:probable addiction module antidote protein
MKPKARSSPARFVPFDPADFLGDEQTQLTYLNLALEDGDAAEVLAALGTIARARGMTHIARASRLGRESLYKALSLDGNPSFRTVLGVAGILGYRLQAAAKKPTATRSRSRTGSASRTA